MNFATLELADVIDRPYHEAVETVMNWFHRAYGHVLLTRHHWNVTEAARQAQVDRVTVYRIMRKGGLARPAALGAEVASEAVGGEKAIGPIAEVLAPPLGPEKIVCFPPRPAEPEEYD